MSDAAVRVLPNGHILVDTQHVDARTIVRALHAFSMIEAYTGRFVRCRLHRTSLWGAAASGYTSTQIITYLHDVSGAPLDPVVVRTIHTLMQRWGQITLMGAAHMPLLVVNDDALRERLRHIPALATFLRDPSPDGWRIDGFQRGALAQALWRIGWPLDDRAEVVDGQEFVCQWSTQITLRPYQTDAITACLAYTHGVVSLPPGSGKTFIGVGLLAHIQRHTLIITTSRAAANQWRDSVLQATTCQPHHVAIYRGTHATLAPITITTYQQLVARTALCHAADWGLIVYDEVHTLPAPVFRTTAALSTRRRYGLSATLIREDGRIGDVYSLVGPQRYTLPWRTLEAQGFIAPASCIEVRVAMSRSEREGYLQALPRHQGQQAACIAGKYAVVTRIAERHAGQAILVIGHYLAQLHTLATQTGWPLITGDTPHAQRDAYYAAFRAGQIAQLIVSRVGNQAIDLPSASVLIQVSGSFGSRQEEAQRLGRILRPKGPDHVAVFYTLVSAQSREVDDAWQRQRFLVAQGYRYQHLDEGDI
jgi:DNA excision repair protein ERCC-3